MTTSAPSLAPPGAFPWIGDARGRGFLLHAVVALLALLYLNWLIVTEVPFAIQKIGSSYLIFFYHFPSALSTFVFYMGVMVAGVCYLATKNPVWDRRAQADRKSHV